MFESKSVELTINSQKIKVHGFSTGAVKVKTKFLEASRKGLFAQLDIIFNKRFTEWLPVWVWVIEHPEGIYVIDAGITSDTMSRAYFKVLGFFSNWVNTSLFKFKVNRQEEIDKQLESINISPNAVKVLILTHLHVDHILGIKHFPKAEILVNRLEWNKPSGDVPRLYPEWFKPVLVDLDERFETFNNARFLTKAKDVLLIHTPGHTHGHSSVVLKTDQGNILFAGDICYYQQQLSYDRYAGANISAGEIKNTYKKILNFAASTKVIFLPSHDKDAAIRLDGLIPLVP
jgi:N-acyl homoserine lactone hydrolase